MVLFLSNSSLHQTLVTTYSNVMDYMSDERNFNSSGLRLSWYEAGLRIFSKNIIAGVGVGDVSVELRNQFESGLLFYETDNVHNEYLNMGMAGGLVALTLFILFWGSIFFTRVEQPLDKFLLTSIGSITLISCFFNSTIKDYGEKHILLILAPLAVVYLLGGRKRLSSFLK